MDLMNLEKSGGLWFIMMGTAVITHYEGENARITEDDHLRVTEEYFARGLE